MEPTRLSAVSALQLPLGEDVEKELEKIHKSKGKKTQSDLQTILEEIGA